MAYHSAQGPGWRPKPAAWWNSTCPTSRIHCPTRCLEGSGRLSHSHTGLDLGEVHPNGNKLSARIKYILQKNVDGYANINTRGMALSSGHILVGSLGIQRENGHRRRTDHHGMEFQPAQLLQP